MTSHGRQIIICTIDSKLYIMAIIIQVKNTEHINTISKIYINSNFSIDFTQHYNGIVRR